MDSPRPGFVAMAKEVMARVKFHNVMVSAAGVAFYGLLALVPTLIALVSVYALISEPADIERQVNEAAGSLDDATKEFVKETLSGIVGDTESQADDEGGGIGGLVGRIGALAFGILLALFSASGALQKLMGTINLAYETVDQRPGWKVRGLAYLFTAGAIISLALMVFAIGAIPRILDRVELGDAAELLIGIVRLPLLAAVFGGALTILYRYGPDRSPRTPWRNPGALVGLVLFILFAVGFSIYSSNVGAMPAAYGLLGTIAALMIFLQLTALSVIIGAEVNGAVEVGAIQVDAVGATPGAAAKAAPRSVSVRSGTQGREETSFAKAFAGVAALLVLGRRKGG